MAQLIIALLALFAASACVPTPEPPARDVPFDTPVESDAPSNDMMVLDGHAERSTATTRADFTSLRLDDPDQFTIEVPLRLLSRPSDRVALVSNWDGANDERGIEIGVNAFQLPYVALSTDGIDHEVFVADRSIRLDRDALITVTYRRGLRLAVYLDGELVGDFSRIPQRLHVSSATTTFGNRPAGAFGPDALLGTPAVSERAAPESQVVQRAADRGASPTTSASLRRVTTTPGFHWFAYYDKLQFSPDNRYLLTARANFEGRSPNADDIIEVGTIDLANGDRWRKLGETRAWNWQQGTMLQWRPGSQHEVLFNDRDDAAFVTRVVDARNGQLLRTLPRPTYHVSPDGRAALGLDFARIETLRRGYGYAGGEDSTADVVGGAPIYVMDLETGTYQDILNLHTVVAIPTNAIWGASDIHYFNHLQWSPDGSRFLFFHRWRRAVGGFGTRVFSANADGTSPTLVTDERGASHYTWFDNERVLLWMEAYHAYTLYEIGAPNTPIDLILRASNGHQSYLPNTNNRWLLTDTYPVAGYQTLFLYDTQHDEVVVLARIPGPHPTGEFRVDLHPRVSADGRLIAIDSAASGGRQQWVIDIQGVVD